MSTVTIADASRQLSQLINRAAYGNDVVVLTSRGQPKAVLLGIEAFDYLVGLREHSEVQLMPLDKFQSEFRQALKEAGYDSKEDMVELVRDVKREIAIEKGRKLQD